jgi:hypothetical protein
VVGSVKLQLSASPGFGFGSGFQFRQVEINALSAFSLRPPSVKQGQRGPQETRRYGIPLYRDLRFIQMQPALPMHEGRQCARLQSVLFALVGVGIPQGALDCVFAVPGCSHRVLEAMPGRILIIV